MSDVAYVEQAAEWARLLTQREMRGPGDLESAWRRLEARYGVSLSTFWSLRYRRPKGILASTFNRLRAAYEAECARQMRKLEHEIAITKTIAGDCSAAVCAVEALVGKDES
jgi:hypothetical protein